MTEHTPLAFPSRPVKLLATGAPSIFISYMLALACAALAAYLSWSSAPGIWSDLQITRDPVAVEDGTMRNALCKKRKVIFHDCSADVSYRVDGTNYRHHVDLAFLSFHSGYWSAEVVRSASRPHLATLDIGLDMIWNRLGLLVVLVGSCVAAMVFFLHRARKSRQTKALEGMTTEMAAVKALIRGEQSMLGRKIITYTCHVDGKDRNFVTWFKNNASPFFIGRGYDEALAVLPSNGSTPVLLDGALSRIELSAAERDELQRLSSA